VVDKRSKRMSLRLKKSTANVISSMAQQAPMSTQRAPKTPAYSPDQLVVEIVVPGFDTAYAEVCFDQSTVVVAVLAPIHLVVVLLLLPRTSLSRSQLFEEDEKFKAAFGCSKPEYLNFSAPKRNAMRREAGYA
jgi:hypothetical protein